MIRNLKALGLALVAVFAMSAIVASAASAAAAHFTADSTTTNAIFKATADPSEANQEFETEFGIVNCNIVTAHGTAHQTSETLTATDVTYNSNFFEGSNACEAFGLEAEINFNGCDYVFHAGTFDGGGMSTGTADLVCPVGQAVTINVSGLCTVTVPAQNGLSSITYTDGGGTPKDVTLDANVNNITYSGTGILCSGEFGGGIYTGKATVKAYNDNVEEAQVAATITST